MAWISLSEHFVAFFKRLNPPSSFETTAAREYASIKGLIEDRSGPASVLTPRCFLQGSYRQDTAIYTINDVDLVALCELWQPGSGSGPSWSRDEIFGTIAAPLMADRRYRDKVRYGPTSMCIKVDLGIKVEILPVVYKAGTYDFDNEPFRLYRPEAGAWQDGYARYHQQHLTAKNRPDRTAGNFIPAIKVMKHLRSRFGLDAVSFHIECLLFYLNDERFNGGPAEYIPHLLSRIASESADTWYERTLNTPCRDRNIFTSSEWPREKWQQFHNVLSTTWKPLAERAAAAMTKDDAIRYWRALLGEDFFPLSA